MALFQWHYFNKLFTGKFKPYLISTTHFKFNLKQYEGMTEEEIKEMSLKDFEAHENDRMTKNAWVVAEELVKRIDGAPGLGEYIHCQLSEEPSKMSFFNRDSLQAY